MRHLLPALLVISFASQAMACAAPVCQVPQAELSFGRVITFDDLPSSPGVGRELEGVLDQPGAQFGERFAGQLLLSEGGFDRIEGRALAPLSVLAGQTGQSLGVMRLTQTSVLQGYGPQGFPNVDAIGEGAVAIVFDRDQSAIGLDIRGGEAGMARVVFLRRDGSEIAALEVQPLAEDSYGFRRNAAVPDIAGILILNRDPQGIALDNIRFDGLDLLG
ncbi:MAG: hypothetical protein VX083_14150 [Pseudomonadota bacterium]|jgi:hypothetical protein|nr:hypothetical protein [Pseudomonadota bacterium]MEC8294630.1 hypothetical protein [Pseudomonadota bacterium]